MKRLTCIIVLTVVGITLLTMGCTQKPEKVKIGYFPVSGDLAFFVGVEKGFFKEEGLDVEPVKFAESKEAMDAMLTGRVDVCAPMGFTTIFAVEQNQTGLLKIFLPGGEAEGHIVSHLIVKKDSNIRSIEDLKGKKIGTYAGTAHRMWLELLLKRLNLDPEKDVTIVQVASNLLVPSLMAGQFDALYATEPYTTTALIKGMARSLIDNPRSKYIINPFPSGSFVFTTKFWEEKPKIAMKIYQAMKKSIDFMRANELEAKMILPKYTPIDEEIAKACDVHAIYEINDTTIGAIQELANMLFEYKLLEKKIEVKGMLLTDEDFK